MGTGKCSSFITLGKEEKAERKHRGRSAGGIHSLENGAQPWTPFAAALRG